MSAEEPTAREQIIAQRAQDSAVDFIEHGPRLWTGRQAYVLARGDHKVLLGGCGAMGLGVMWVDERDHHLRDPTYADAPYEPDRRDDFGDTGRAPA